MNGDSKTKRDTLHFRLTVFGVILTSIGVVIGLIQILNS